MAINRLRGAFTVPRKGETFELRAGLVYGNLTPGALCRTMLTGTTDLSMHMNGTHDTYIWICSWSMEILTLLQERGHPKDHHGHDFGQGCVRSVPRRP